MKLNSIEKALIKEFFYRKGITVGDDFFSGLNVSNRELSVVGFLTDLERCSQLKMGEENETYKFGDLGAKINESIDTGYLVFVKNGFLDAIEGYTYTDDWPEEISKIDIYSK
ncbi:hypothetical protein [Vibrio sonorensis]|uniref:hypothetical protein n=1 Tax=Vibrio sonorensis TaxID=1004316 RepID=UPI001113A63E|nr:hypothetical protein [Vibrio sonorensis]